MFSASLKWPILLAVVLLSLIVGFLVFWIIGQAMANQWTMLAIGSVLLTLILAGVVLYLILSIQHVQLTRRQANFIDSVTHELKSPIAAVKLYLQTLQIREVEPEQRAEFHKNMLEELNRLDHLIDDLLRAARLLHHEQPEPVQDLALIPILESCVESIQRRYQLTPEQLQMDLEPCLVQARSSDLELILGNLLDNAAKYAGDPPLIHVQVTIRGQKRVLVRISDNGKGIRFDLRRKIFERFVRGGSELERTTKGTGLGLYLVKSIVQKLRGRIHVHGWGRLGGATFEVEFPGRRLELVTHPVSEPVSAVSPSA